jgi:hypothetical protein
MAGNRLLLRILQLIMILFINNILSSQIHGKENLNRLEADWLGQVWDLQKVFLLSYLESFCCM